MTEQIVQPFQRKVRSFVLREGRLTKGQSDALKRLFPAFGLEVDDSTFDFATIFENSHPTVLEIGFGNGESLANMAKASPELNFIGVEVHRPGVGHLLKKIEEYALTNLRVMCADATEVLQRQIPDSSLHRLQLYFADPWPKKKHHKRRIVQENFVQMVAQKLVDGGTFHLATDWKDYALHMLSVLDDSALENIAGTGQFTLKPDYRPTTKFETRGIKLGHGVWDLIYKKPLPENT